MGPSERLGRSLSLLLVLFTSCGGRGGPIGHPTEPDELVLRLETGGGLVPLELGLTELPGFSIYGDGTAIVAPSPDPKEPFPELAVLRFTRAGVRSLLSAAEEAGLMEDRRFEVPDLYDATTTTFTLVAEGERHVTAVYALGYPGTEGGSDEERLARAELLALAERLRDPAAWLPGQVDEAGPYRFPALRVYVLPGPESMDPGYRPEGLAWPLPEPPASFGRPAEAPGVRCGVVEGRVLTDLLPRLEGTDQATVWEWRDEPYRLAFRPLLPDESGC